MKVYHGVLSIIVVFFVLSIPLAHSRSRHGDARMPFSPILKKSSSSEDRSNIPIQTVFFDTAHVADTTSIRLNNGKVYNDDGGDRNVNIGINNDALVENLHVFLMLTIVTSTTIGAQYDILNWMDGNLSLGALATIPPLNGLARGAEFHISIEQNIGSGFSILLSNQLRSQKRLFYHSDCTDCSDFALFDSSYNEVKVKENIYDILAGLRFNLKTFSIKALGGYSKVISGKVVEELYSPANYQHKQKQFSFLLGAEFNI